MWAKSSECLAWAGDGQCKANEAFMAVQCAWSCHKIELAARRYRRRCPRPENYAAALAPGEMNATFARVLTDFPELQPEQISADPPVQLTPARSPKNSPDPDPDPNPDPDPDPDPNPTHN